MYLKSKKVFLAFLLYVTATFTDNIQVTITKHRILKNLNSLLQSHTNEKKASYIISFLLGPNVVPDLSQLENSTEKSILENIKISILQLEDKLLTENKRIQQNSTKSFTQGQPANNYQRNLIDCLNILDYIPNNDILLFEQILKCFKDSLENIEK